MQAITKYFQNLVIRQTKSIKFDLIRCTRFLKLIILLKNLRIQNFVLTSKSINENEAVEYLKSGLKQDLPN